jgi:hypothetical protein
MSSTDEVHARITNTKGRLKTPPLERDYWADIAKGRMTRGGCNGGSLDGFSVKTRDNQKIIPHQIKYLRSAGLSEVGFNPPIKILEAFCLQLTVKSRIKIIHPIILYS